MLLWKKQIFSMNETFKMYRLPMMPSIPYTFTQSWMVAFTEALIRIFSENCKMCLFGQHNCSVLCGWGRGQRLWSCFCLSFPVTTILCGCSGKLWTVVSLEGLLAHAELHKWIWSTDICNVTKWHSPLLLKKDSKPNNSFNQFATFYFHSPNFKKKKKATRFRRRLQPS